MTENISINIISHIFVGKTDESHMYANKVCLRTKGYWYQAAGICR